MPRTNDTVPRTNDTVPRTNYSVPRNVYQPPQRRENVPRNDPIAPSSDVRVRAPLGNINSSVWHNSSLSSQRNNCLPVPRNNVTDRQTSERETVPPPPKRKRKCVQRRERRERELAERTRIEEAFIHDAQWAAQSSGAPSSTTVPDQLTVLGLPHSDPISAMRPAVYPPVTLEGGPLTNDIPPSNLTRSLVNQQAYSQAYINRPFQTLSTSLGSYLLGRAARKKNLPLLPELLGRAAQGPGHGQESSTPFSHARNVLMSILK